MLPVLRRSRDADRPRAPWGLLDVVLAVAGSWFGGQIAYGLFLEGMGALDAHGHPRSGHQAAFLAGQLLYYAVSLAIAVLVVAGRRHVGLREMGWRGTSLRWIGAAVPLAMLALLLAGVLGGVAQTLLPHATNQQCTTVQTEYGHAVGLALPVVCLAAPLVEETIFRGVLYRWLRGVSPVGVAMVISAAVFAGAHALELLFLPLFGVGLVLAWCYERSGSIVPGVVVHGLFNLAGIVTILGGSAC